MVDVNPWAVVALLLLAAALVALVEYGSRKADRAGREWFAEQERSREDRRGASRFTKKRPRSETMTTLTPNHAIVPTEIGGLYDEDGIDLIHVEDTGIDGEEIVTPIKWVPHSRPITEDEDPGEIAEEVLEMLGYEITGLWEYTDEYAVAPIAKKEAP